MPETTQGAWEGPRFDRWILRERTLLNPRSAGGPTYLAALEAEAAGSWEAGDIADIQPGVAADQPLREYSIASLPGDGCLQLVVRQAQRQDGSLGIGSGWLTAHAPLHGAVMLRIRANPEFRAPLDDRPLILISNGTGIAGLRALLKARVAADRRRNWLIFGERHRQHDFYFRDELSALNASGQLGMDLAFSRDQEARI